MSPLPAPGTALDRGSTVRASNPRIGAPPVGGAARTRRLRRTAIVAVVLTLMSAAAADSRQDQATVAPQIQLRLDCQRRAEATLDVPAGPLAIEVESGEPGLLHIEERGQDVTMDSEAQAPARWVQVPPRFGMGMLRLPAASRVTLQRVVAGHAPGMITLRLHCDPGNGTVARMWDWLGAAHDTGAALVGGIGSLDFSSIEADLDALARTAFDPLTHAFSRHLRAQALLLAGRSADAAPAFLDAAQAWTDLGMPERAAAARVGAAEDLYRAGRYLDVLALSRHPSGERDGTSYFGVRLEKSRCVALHYLGRIDDAAQCYDWTSARLMALGELRELAVTALDFAALERSLGRHAEARVLLSRTLDMAVATEDVSLAGRARFALADVAIRTGDVAEALLHLRLAGERFAVARESRWEASMRLRLASLLVDLGAHVDARIAALHGLSLLQREHAPARVAAAEALLARIDRVEGRYDEGLSRSNAAWTAFRALSMPEEATLAGLEHAQLLTATGQFQDALDTLAAIESTSPYAHNLLHLARAETELARGEWNAAAAVLPQISAGLLSLEDRLRHTRISAWLAWNQGRPDAAMALLAGDARALRRWSAATGSALLSHALTRRTEQLRMAAIEMIAMRLARSEPNFQAAAAAVEWLAHSTTPRLRSDDHLQRPGDPARRVDASARKLLLATASEPSEADWDALLTMLEGEASASEAASHDVDAARWQRSLTRDGAVLALLEGEHRALLVRLAQDSVELHVVADLPALRASLKTLSRLLGDPGSPTQDVERIAAGVSATLLQPVTDALSSDRLRILNDGLGARVPWSLLASIDRSATSAEYGMTSLVEVDIDGSGATPLRRGTLDILQAVQPTASGNHDSLSLLHAAAMEARSIESVLGPAVTQLHRGASREQWLAVLARAGARVHVSAHGALAPGLIAGSGLWLEPAAPDAPPEYLSWIDLHRGGSNAALIVLNACQLAAGNPDAASASMSFATALARAGAQHVVAARWPVSDTASNLWVPAFYKALDSNDPPDPAFALAEARRALRASRAFRHPFHWAGWVHIERVRDAD